MTHPNEPIGKISGTNTPLQEVDNYLLIQQDDPTRPAVYASGDLYTFYTTTRESGGDFNFFDFFIPVDQGPPPHYHPFEDEIWHVIHGDLRYDLGNQGTDSIVVPEGTTIFSPIDRVHGYFNESSKASISGVTEGARTLSMTSPGLLDLFFDAISTRVTDRNEEIPGFIDPTDFDPLINIAQFNARTSGSIAILGIIGEYTPPDDVLDYVLVLPEDATEEKAEEAKALADIDGFSVWTTGDHEGLQQREKFTGDFGIEYTSLVNFEEAGGEFSYNQFSLDPQSHSTFVEVKLTGSEVSQPIDSLANGLATLKSNDQGDIEYKLTVTGLDFGLFEGSLQTPNELDDVTAIHIHSGERGKDGSHVFDILDLNGQDETDLKFSSNDDGSMTISGSWGQTEREIPPELSNFLNNGGIPGEEEDFYIQVHTKGNPDGEIRGQVALSTDAFPDAVKSKNREVFYIKEGQLSFKINDEVRLAESDTYVYIAPGNEYSFANFGTETVESLAVTLIPEEPYQKDDKLHHHKPLPSPLKVQEAQLPKKVEVLDNNKPNFFNPASSSEDSPTRYRIYGGDQDDELYADSGDRLFGREGNDILDASQGKGGNRLYGGKGNDEIILNTEDRGFGGHGNDIIDASNGKGYNLLDGGYGDDTLLGSSNDELRGGDGDDVIKINGSKNLLYGGSGADEFGIFDGRLPDAVAVEYSDFAKSLLPEGILFPDLMDAQNIIADFKIGTDKIVIDGVFDTVIDGKNVSFNIQEFDDLELLPTFEDFENTSIIGTFTEDGVEKEISLANVNGIYFNELSASDFEFLSSIS